MNRNRTVARIMLLILVAALFAGAFATSALAQGATKRVGLVVHFSNGSEHLQIVTVPAAANALDALKASSLTIEYADSSYGPSLCRIGADGCPAGNCFCDPTAFWAFWTLNAAGNGWDASPVGVGAYTPKDKDVIGFSWSGFDANFNPTVKPNVHTFSELEKLTPAPNEVPEPATLILLGGGLSALAGYIGLRRKSR
jgi:hypothetical protein